MAQPQSRTRQIRTLPPAAAVGQPVQVQKDDEVTLSDGRTVKLRLLNGLDSTELEQAMEDAGFTQMSGPGRATYLRCRGLFAVLEIDGKMQTPPRSGGELKARLSVLLDGDCMAIASAYMRLAGEVPKTQATFPQEGGDAAQS